MRVALLIGWLMLGLVACRSDDEGSGTAGDSAGDGDGDGDGDAGETCNVTAPTACPSDMPTYADVEPIFQQRCAVCHMGQGLSELCPQCWALNEYRHIADWKLEIKTALLSCEMPPRASGMTISNAERVKILEWIRCDAPE